MEKEQQFYDYDTCVQMHQAGKFGYLGFIEHVDEPEYRQEYTEFCERNNLDQSSEESAKSYFDELDVRLMDGFERIE